MICGSFAAARTNKIVSIGGTMDPDETKQFGTNVSCPRLESWV